MFLFLAPRSKRRPAPAPPSATGLQHTHELATPMHACEVQRLPVSRSPSLSGTPWTIDNRQSEFLSVFSQLISKHFVINARRLPHLVNL
jgi:hypothetical protein